MLEFWRDHNPAFHVGILKRNNRKNANPISSMWNSEKTTIRKKPGPLIPMLGFLKTTMKKTPDPHYHKTQKNAKATISSVKIPETNNAVFALSKKLKATIKKKQKRNPIRPILVFINSFKRPTMSSSPPPL
jgi:hypothetical protein